jgi:hypothetical protein
MHHCVGTYTGDIRDGHLYVYSVRRDGERVATLALARDQTGTKAQLVQLCGPCNAQPPQAIASAVNRWLRAQGPLPAVKLSPERLPELNQIAEPVAPAQLEEHAIAPSGEGTKRRSITDNQCERASA